MAMSITCAMADATSSSHRPPTSTFHILVQRFLPAITFVAITLQIIYMKVSNCPIRHMYLLLLPAYRAS